MATKPPRYDDFFTAILAFIGVPTVPYAIGFALSDQLRESELFMFVAFYGLSAGISARYRSILLLGILVSVIFSIIYVFSIFKSTPVTAQYLAILSYYPASLAIIHDKFYSHLREGRRVFTFES